MIKIQNPTQANDSTRRRLAGGVVMALSSAAIALGVSVAGAGEASAGTGCDSYPGAQRAHNGAYVDTYNANAVAAYNKAAYDLAAWGRSCGYHVTITNK